MKAGLGMVCYANIKQHKECKPECFLNSSEEAEWSLLSISLVGKSKFEIPEFWPVTSCYDV